MMTPFIPKRKSGKQIDSVDDILERLFEIRSTMRVQHLDDKHGIEGRWTEAEREMDELIQDIGQAQHIPDPNNWALKDINPMKGEK